MAWTEVHQTLTTHRKLYALAGAWHTTRAAAAGYLVFLWLWALDNAPDGRLAEIDPHALKLAADWPKSATSFIEGLTGAGFLDADRRIHDWDDYAGRLIAKRAANKERMRGARAAHELHTSVARAMHVQGLQNSTVQNTTEPPAADDDHTVAAAAAATNGVHLDVLTRCIRAYDGLMGTVATTPPILEAIKGWHEKGAWAFEAQPAELFEAACSEAAQSNGKSLKYVLAILERWQREGRGKRQSSNGAPVVRDPYAALGTPELPAEMKAWIREDQEAASG